MKNKYVVKFERSIENLNKGIQLVAQYRDADELAQKELSPEDFAIMKAAKKSIPVIFSRMKEIAISDSSSYFYEIDEDGSIGDHIPGEEVEVSRKFFGPRLPGSRIEDAKTIGLSLSAFTSGDYTGSIVGISNRRVLKKEFKEHFDKDLILTMRDSYRYKTLVFTMAAFQNQKLVETLKSLGDYIILDEDDYIELCMEMQNEEWQSNYKDDVVRELERGSGEERPELEVTDAISEKLDDFRYHLESDGGLEWREENSSFYPSMRAEEFASEFVKWLKENPVIENDEEE